MTHRDRDERRTLPYAIQCEDNENRKKRLAPLLTGCKLQLTTKLQQGHIIWGITL